MRTSLHGQACDSRTPCQALGVCNAPKGTALRSALMFWYTTLVLVPRAVLPYQI